MPVLRAPCQSPAMSWAWARLAATTKDTRIKMRFMPLALLWGEFIAGRKGALVKRFHLPVLPL